MHIVINKRTEPQDARAEVNLRSSPCSLKCPDSRLERLCLHTSEGFFRALSHVISQKPSLTTLPKISLLPLTHLPPSDITWILTGSLSCCNQVPRGQGL